MRAREFNWLGQRFVYLNLEAERGGSLEQQSQALFERAGAELSARGLALDQQRGALAGVRPHPRGARRGQRRARHDLHRPGPRRHLELHLAGASRPPPTSRSTSTPWRRRRGRPRKVTEMEPVQPFIRHLVWGPFVFHAGMTCETLPTLREQCAEMLPRAGALLTENGCGWENVVRVSFFLHRSEDPKALLDGVAPTGAGAARQLRGRAGRRLFAAGQAGRDRGHGEAIASSASRALSLRCRSP